MEPVPLKFILFKGRSSSERTVDRNIVESGYSAGAVLDKYPIFNTAVSVVHSGYIKHIEELKTL